jgi:hypothetical protein
MIRLLYWLIKKRWSVCFECKYCNMEPNWTTCQYYKALSHNDFVQEYKAKYVDTLCAFVNSNGACWGFKKKGELFNNGLHQK